MPGDARLECADWLCDLRRALRDVGLLALPREPTLSPLFERLRSRVQHVEPPATCICNMCERMDACHSVSSPSLGGPALVTPGLFHPPLLLLLLLLVGCLLPCWVRRVGTAAENTASSPGLPLGRLLQAFPYITHHARYQLRCQPATTLEVKAELGCS